LPVPQAPDGEECRLAAKCFEAALEHLHQLRQKQPDAVAEVYDDIELHYRHRLVRTQGRRR